MAQLFITLSVETELLSDASADIERIARAVAKRHGAPFRALDRRIEGIFEGEEEIAPGELIPLETGRFIALPPPAFVEIIAQARALGVI